MLYIVEIALSPDVLASEMSNMRIWLDHMHYQPLGFRSIGDKRGCRIDFRDRREAKSFACAFGGRILPATAAS